MLTTVYNLAQSSDAKTAQIVFGISGYTLSDTPTKVGYGLTALPTTIGYIRKGGVGYETYNANKTVLDDFIIGSIVKPKTKMFTARVECLLEILQFAHNDSEVVIIADINSFENIYRNYTEKSVEYLEKVRKGIEQQHELYDGVDFNYIVELSELLKAASATKTVKFFIYKPIEEKVNYGILLAQMVVDWTINCAKSLPLERLDYLPQEDKIDLPTIISDYPRVHFNSRLEDVTDTPNVYYLNRISTSEEELLGCRINDVSYCYLQTNEPIAPLDAAIDTYRSLNHYTDLHVTRVNVEALKSKGQRYFTERGLYRSKESRKGALPMGHMHGLVMLDPNDQIIMNDIVPTGLSMIIADHFKELVDIRTLAPDKMVEIVSVKDFFFESTVKKDKVKYALKKEFGVGSKSVTMLVDSAKLDRKVSLNLFFGYDCYSRNALARFADELVDFSIVLYERSPGNYRYATLLETTSLVAVVATCHANKLYLFSESL